MREEVAAFVQEHEAAVRPLEKALNEAAWHLAVTGVDRWKAEVVRLGIARRSLYAEPVGYRRLRDWYARLEELADPLLARQVQELFLEFRASQMDRETLEVLERLQAEAEQRFDTFRSTLDGRPVTANTLEQILRASKDAPLRQRAWEASQQIGPEVAPLIREMVRLRNRVARGRGSPTTTPSPWRPTSSRRPGSSPSWRSWIAGPPAPSSPRRRGWTRSCAPGSAWPGLSSAPGTTPTPSSSAHPPAAT